MKHQTINLVKFKAFSKRVKAPLCHAVGYLETLWIFAQIQARDGDLSRFTPLEIAGWIEYPGEPSELISALIECRWLDRDGDSLRIHGWSDHKPNWLKGVDAKRALGTEPSTEPSTEPGSVPGSEPSTEPPNLTQPNPTKPNQISAAAKGAAVDFSDLDFGAVTAEANKLSRADPSLDRDFVWQVCCVGEFLEHGLIADMAARIRAKEVRRPKGYISTAMREECTKRGFDWSIIREQVPPAPPRKEPISA